MRPCRRLRVCALVSESALHRGAKYRQIPVWALTHTIKIMADTKLIREKTTAVMRAASTVGIKKFLPGAAQYPQFYWPDYPPSVPERNGGNAAINNQKRPDAPALQNAAQSRQTANPARGTCSLLLSINPPLN